MTTMIKKLDEERNQLIEYNDLIRSMPFLTEYQYNVFKAILCLVGDQDNNYDTCLYRLDINTFRRIFQINSNTIYQKVRESLESLQDKKLRKELMKDGIKGFFSSQLISGFQYFEGEGYVEVEIPTYIRQLVSNVRGGHFTKVELEMISMLKGSNTKRLYEILKSWEANGYYRVPTIELKNIMDLNFKHKRENEFVSRVIKPAIKKINENSDLLIKLIVVGRGESTKLKFHIGNKDQIAKSERNKYSLDVDLNNPLNIHIWERLGIEEDIERKDYQKLLRYAEQYCEKYIDPKYYLHYYLCYTESLTITPNDQISYVIKLLKNDFESVWQKPQAHKIECFEARQDGRVRSA